MVNRSALIETFVEVTLPDRSSFGKTRETLTRIGEAAGDVLHQLCYILHKKGRYYIVHYKEMHALDGQTTKMGPFDDDDRRERDTIASLLQDWGLVTVIGDLSDDLSMDGIRVIHYGEKDRWKLNPLYDMGRKRE